MTEDLAAWLLEQIAEDEAPARAFLNACPDGDPVAEATVYSDRYDDLTEMATAHLDRWGAKRVLAECDAKRQLVELHKSEDVDGRLTDGEEITVLCCVVCRDENGMREEEPCPTLRLLALPHADRPGYREEWRP
jgi:hypothetical protein